MTDAPLAAACALVGQAIEVRYSKKLRDTAGNPAHAATFIRQRLIVLDHELRRDPSEHRRILVHELFHFVWVRLGNPKRRAWENQLRLEWNARARGEAGWSAEWRKRDLGGADVKHRTRKWRQYCCESFCDTAAALHTNARSEVTLPRGRLAARRAWFAEQLASPLPI
jgi:hypothetical protein